MLFQNLQKLRKLQKFTNFVIFIKFAVFVRHREIILVLPKTANFTKFYKIHSFRQDLVGSFWSDENCEIYENTQISQFLSRPDIIFGFFLVPLRFFAIFFIFLVAFNQTPGVLIPEVVLTLVRVKDRSSISWLVFCYTCSH